jgi:hypothetical protein
MGFNVLSMLQAAVETQHGIEPRSPEELSLYYLAGEVKRMHAGMMLALPAEHWSTLRDLPLDDFCALLLRIAAYANPAALRKTRRGPTTSPLLDFSRLRHKKALGSPDSGLHSCRDVQLV